MRFLVSLCAGLLFGFGLIVSGMTNPAKVQNFLDLFGSWDPSLAFVMGGAIAVALPGFKLAERMNKPIFADNFLRPTLSKIDARLIGGASLFGIGWGLGGFCPGPAITAVSSGTTGVMTFVAAMLVGMFGVKLARI